MQLIKRSHKRREMDADFEEKRFNLSLGQAELDRENDYYTRPASPVLKPVPQDPEGFDPYDERQAIRHFRGGTTVTPDVRGQSRITTFSRYFVTAYHHCSCLNRGRWI